MGIPPVEELRTIARPYIVAGCLLLVVGAAAIVAVPILIVLLWLK